MSSKQACMDVLFPKKIKEKTPGKLKEELINVATNFVIENCMPITIVEFSAFPNLFAPLHEHAAQITTQKIG